MISIIVALSISLTNQEQLLVELVNRARANPRAEAALYGVDLNDGLEAGTISSAAKPPLAPHQALVNAARAHSQDMLNQNYFSHTNKSGKSPTDRAKAAGYPNGVGENIAWGGSSRTIDPDAHVYLRHKQLFLSPGHRRNMLTPRYREIGAGMRIGVFTREEKKTRKNASMVTEKFGTRGGDAFITGVVFADEIVEDDFYTIGEGAANVSISAVPRGTGASYTVTTGPAGGYSLRVSAGTYTVTASGESIIPIVAEDIVVDAQNVKVDFEASGLALRRSSFVQIIDDGDTGYAISGSWTGSGLGGFGEDSLVASNSSDDLATWSFQVTPGRYRVSATWSKQSSGATDAQFTIWDGCRSLATVDINQQREPSGFSDAGTKWKDLGGSYEITGTALVVDLSGTENGDVVADAIRIERLSDKKVASNKKVSGNKKRRQLPLWKRVKNSTVRYLFDRE